MNPQASMANRPLQPGLASSESLLAKAKIELPSGNQDEQAFGGTRTVVSAYKFDVTHQIGEGTYGQVFLGNDISSQDRVALKKIRMDTEKEGFPITAIREIKILSTLQHENVVNLREIVRSEIHRNNNFKGSIYMVFDYADYDLTGLMETVKYKFTEAQVKCIMKQLLRGLAYVHNNGVLHRDLKASNILIDRNGCVKLADFGLARTYQQQQDSRLTNRVITLWYRPPELLLGADRYGPEIDMWSVGCIFAELLVGKPIFPGKDEMDQLDKIFQVLGTPNEANWPGVEKLPNWHIVVKDKYKSSGGLRKWLRETAAKSGTPVPKEAAVQLLEKMLALCPSKRISALDAFQDTWFWNSDPAPCDPRDLPCNGSSHEFTMKRRRQEEKEMAAVAMPHAAGGHHMMARGPMGGPHAAGGAPGAHHPGYFPGPDPKRPRHNPPPGGPGGYSGVGGAPAAGGRPVSGMPPPPAPQHGGAPRMGAPQGGQGYAGQGSAGGGYAPYALPQQRGPGQGAPGAGGHAYGGQGAAGAPPAGPGSYRPPAPQYGAPQQMRPPGSGGSGPGWQQKR